MKLLRTRRQDLAARELAVLHREQRAREHEDQLHAYAATLTERDADLNSRERALHAALSEPFPTVRDWGAEVRRAHYEQQGQVTP